MLHAFISTCKLKRVSSRREKIKKQKRKNNNASRSRVARVTTLRLRACTARACARFPASSLCYNTSHLLISLRNRLTIFFSHFSPAQARLSFLSSSLPPSFRYFILFFIFYISLLFLFLWVLLFFYTREVVPRTRSESDLRDIVRARRNGNVSKKGVFEKYTVAV